MGAPNFPTPLNPADYIFTLDGPTFTDIFNETVGDALGDNEPLDAILAEMIVTEAELEAEVAASFLDLPDLSDLDSVLDTGIIDDFMGGLGDLISTGDAQLNDVTALLPGASVSPPSEPGPPTPTPPGPGGGGGGPVGSPNPTECPPGEVCPGTRPCECIDPNMDCGDPSCVPIGPLPT
jgi:hypothetical protein